jgi:putative FmdB family regulatory protein
VSKSAKIGTSVALILAAVVIYVVRSGGSASEITAATDYNALLKCRGCGNEFKATLDVADEPPYKCPKCGKREAWKLAECHKCGNIFLPPVSGDPPRPPMIPTCPKCGSQQAGAAIPR